MKDHDFFKDTPRKTLDMSGQPIEFPVLYYDFRFVNCIFTTKISRLKQILPHPQFNPIHLWPGTGMLAISAFEYRDTSIGPYNEVAISVPINFPPASSLGKISALSMMSKNIFPAYIYQLPVTTEIARAGGVYFYNYPKFIAEIDFEDRQDHFEITLKEKDELILKLLAKKLPMQDSVLFEMHTFSIGDKTIMHSSVEACALKFGKEKLGKSGELELGSHRISEILRSLKLNLTAKSGICGEEAMSKLYAPDQKWDKETLELVSGDM